MVEFDPIVLFSLIVPILIVFGISILSMTLLHLGLSASGNRFATEITCCIGLLIFYVTEVALEIVSIELTLAMFALVTPVMMVEAFRPSNQRTENPLQIITVEEDVTSLSKDVLCISNGDEYTVLTAIRIKGIPLHSGTDSESENLKWLYPLWEDSKRTSSTFTLEAKFDCGLVDLRFFVVNQGKDLTQAIEKTCSSRQLVETWLKRIKYDYDILTSEELKVVYHELEFGPLRVTVTKDVVESKSGFLGGLSIEFQPENVGYNLGEMLQQFLRDGLSGHVQLSLISGQVPKVSSRLGQDRDESKIQSRTPPRIEDHKLRREYKQMAEVEVCEETGSFRVGTSVLLHEVTREDVIHTMKHAKAIIHGIWGGVYVSNLFGNTLRHDWTKFLLRKYQGKSVSFSGARLTGLIQISEAMPGLPSYIVPPSFAIPVLCSSEDSVVIGHVLDRGKPTVQEYSIPLNSFCLHTGIYGNPGSGKTNTGLELTYQVYKHRVPFLAIVPAKTEWRLLAAYIPELRVFTAGDDTTSPFRFNFFEVPSGVPVQTHINNITLCFIANWPTEGILTEHITKIFRRTYTNAGWNLLTNERGSPILLEDLYSAMKEVANELRYGDRLKQDFVGALTSRFESLLDDPVLAVMVNTTNGITIPELLNNPTILELRHLPETQRALVTSLIMVSVTEYLEATYTSTKQELRHLLVLEEAHHILKHVNGYGLNEGHSSQQQAINTMIQLLREARSLCLGVVLIDQLPAELAEAAVKLPGITMIHSLKDPRERLLVGRQANLNDEQLLHIGSLQCGEVVIHQGFTGLAVLTKVVKFNNDSNSKPWTDQRIRDLMAPFFNANPHLREQNLPIISKWKPNPEILDTLKFLTDAPDFTQEYQRLLALDREQANSHVMDIVQKMVHDLAEAENYCAVIVNHLEEVETSG